MRFETRHVSYLLRLSWAPVFLFMTGCTTVGPDYVKPETSLSTTWHSELKGGLIAEELNTRMLATWWSTLHCPELSSLIERAVAGNLDLKKAKARVREARARRALPRLVYSQHWMPQALQHGPKTIIILIHPASFTPQALTQAGNWISLAVSAAL